MAFEMNESFFFVEPVVDSWIVPFKADNSFLCFVSRVFFGFLASSMFTNVLARLRCKYGF